MKVPYSVIIAHQFVLLKGIKESDMAQWALNLAEIAFEE